MRPEPEVVLKNLRVSPVAQLGPALWQSGAVGFEDRYGKPESRSTGREQWMWPKIDVAYLVIAEQGDHVWGWVT